MKFAHLPAMLTTLSLSTGASFGYGAHLRPTGRAAKSPELQQQLIAAAKAKRERRARSPGRCQTKYLKGGIDYVPYAARKPSQGSAWTKCGPSDLNRVFNCPSSVGGAV